MSRSNTTPAETPSVTIERMTKNRVLIVLVSMNRFQISLGSFNSFSHQEVGNKSCNEARSILIYRGIHPVLKGNKDF